MTDLFFDDDVTDDDVLDHGLDPVSTHDSFAVDKSFASAPLQLFGVDDIERRLVDFINQNRLPHGLIFSGPRGVGKASVAMRLARTLLAHVDNPVDNGPGLFGDEPAPVTKLQALDIPPTHPVAQRVAARSHADLLVIGDGGSKSGHILIDDIRKVPAFMRLKPSTENGWRVVIIDNADTMNRNAQNALLKVLEEPPARTVLILVAHQMGTFLPTIRSRTHVIPFHPLSDDDFSRVVKSMDYPIPSSDLPWIRMLSRNCPGQVAGIMDVDGLDLIRTFLDLWESWPQMDEQAWLTFTETMAANTNDDHAFRFIIRFWLWWVDMMVKAKADEGVRQTLLGLTGGQGTQTMIARFSLADLIDLADTLKSHFGRTLNVALERRQALYSGRMFMVPGTL